MTNIRKLEDLSKEELIELIKHEREACGQLKPISVAGLDARLIAAAPDLLEALEKMEKMASTGMVDFNPHDEFVMSSARAAISKALGETK